MKPNVGRKRHKHLFTWTLSFRTERARTSRYATFIFIRKVLLSLFLSLSLSLSFFFFHSSRASEQQSSHHHHHHHHHRPIGKSQSNWLHAIARKGWLRAKTTLSFYSRYRATKNNTDDDDDVLRRYNNTRTCLRSRKTWRSSSNSPRGKMGHF